MIFVIFDTDSNRRTAISDKLRNMGLPINECYSSEKLKLVLDQRKAIYVLVHESLIDDFNEISKGKKVSCQSYRSVCDEFELPRCETSQTLPQIVMIGSSTGGVPVVASLLKELREISNDRIYIICQHIGSGEVTDHLHDSLKKSLQSLKLVKSETVLEKASVYLLAGGSDYEFKQKYGKLYLRSVQSPDARFHPSFDALLSSAKSINNNRLAIILSGLGNDGSLVLGEFKRSGGRVFVQDPNEAIAPFMPQAAIATGFVDDVLNLGELISFTTKCAA